MPSENSTAAGGISTGLLLAVGVAAAVVLAVAPAVTLAVDGGVGGAVALSVGGDVPDGVSVLAGVRDR